MPAAGFATVGAKKDDPAAFAICCSLVCAEPPMSVDPLWADRAIWVAGDQAVLWGVKGRGPLWLEGGNREMGGLDWQ